VNGPLKLVLIPKPNTWSGHPWKLAAAISVAVTCAHGATAQDAQSCPILVRKSLVDNLVFSVDQLMEPNPRLALTLVSLDRGESPPAVEIPVFSKGPFGALCECHPIDCSC
jgi:hypothetical protein